MRIRGALLLLLFIGSIGGLSSALSQASSLGPVQLGPVIEPSRIRTAGFDCTVSRAGSGFKIQYSPKVRKPLALFLLPNQDVSSRLGISIDVSNMSREGVRVYAEINRNTWSAGYVLVPPGTTRTLFVILQRVQFTPRGASERFQGMNGIPGGQMKLWSQAGVDASSISSVSVFLVLPQERTTIEVRSIQPFGSSRVPDEGETAGIFPFVDRYGQLKLREWPGKVHSDHDLHAAIASEDSDLSANPAPSDWDEYGGWAKGPTLKATGHFRVEKYSGRWWLVDPQGHLFWSHGVDVVMAEDSTEINRRERYFEDPAPGGDFLARNLLVKYGADWHTVWVKRIARRLGSWGYNTVGAWSDPSVASTRRMPYTVVLSSGPEEDARFPYSPEWSEKLQRELAKAAIEINDDPWCIGFFVDNEISGTDERWWKAYYSKVSSLAKQLIPNKLYLGSRLDFHDWPNSSAERQSIVRLAAKYTDVISFNQYRYTLEDFTLPADIDKPVIVGEFHFGALDRGSLHTGLRGVHDQSQRADAYQHFVTTALKNPSIVGTHWFQLYDEPVTGRGDGENYQIGLIDICDQPYMETIGAARIIAKSLYQIRAANIAR